MPASETNQEDEDACDDDMYAKLKQQQGRYYIEANPTIKCRNCKEFGHMARECPNERKGLSCILCGKDGHDSFECREKLCFKCNKSGHIASECTEKNVVKCALCGQVGHISDRCLKIWENSQDKKCIGRYEKKGGRHDPFKRCVECNRTGHFKCTKESKSASVNLTFKVMADLDEFFVSESSASSDEGSLKDGQYLGP